MAGSTVPLPFLSGAKFFPDNATGDGPRNDKSGLNDRPRNDAQKYLQRHGVIGYPTGFGERADRGRFIILTSKGNSQWM